MGQHLQPIYFLTAKKTIRRTAIRNNRFNTRIKGIYCDSLEGSAAGASVGFGMGGNAALGGVHGCTVGTADL